MHGSSNNEFIGNIGSCSDLEYRSHFALWAVMGSPLMIGCDVRNMTDVTLETLGNEDLIRINQDIECRARKAPFRRFSCHLLRKLRR